MTSPWRLAALSLFIAGFVVPIPLSLDEPLPRQPVPVVEAAALPAAEPLRLVIPAIGVNAPVQPVRVGEDGKLGVPEEADAVGWWRGGVKPGEKGTAVMDGHLDIGPTKGVFWDLDTLVAGNRILVTDADGVVRLFKVVSTQLYDVRTAPLEEIFGQKKGNHLHLITCAGTWDKELDHYDQRLVVFAELMTASWRTPPTASRSGLSLRPTGRRM